MDGYINKGCLRGLQNCKAPGVGQKWIVLVLWPTVRPSFSMEQFWHSSLNTPGE